VLEWCHDWFGDYRVGPVVDPYGPKAGWDRVRRGGSWTADGGDCRSAYRYGSTPGNHHRNTGFRLARGRQVEDGGMAMTREKFDQLKSLLLDIPGWNHVGTRKAFFQDVFWGHPILDELNYEVPSQQAANDLIERLNTFQKADVDGLTPVCSLLRAIRNKYGAGPQRQRLINGLEAAFCGSTIPSVLFVAVTTGDNLRTDREYKQLDNALRGSSITLHPPVLAPRPDELAIMLHRTQPSLVHFSSYGGKEGILFEDDQGSSKSGSAEALSALFREFSSTVKLVVLNACYSDVQANTIREHIDFVIGFRKEIRDDITTAFFDGFYKALAAGTPVNKAFQQGCAEILVGGGSEYQIPVLMTRK
jgi:hypothetical protein